MTQSISLTIPLTMVALRSTARYMTDLADELESEQLGAPTIQKTTAVGRTETVTIADALVKQPNATTIAAMAQADQLIANREADDDEDDQTTPPGVTVDKTGLPWDERIHASSRALVKDGTWRKRKNVDDATVAAVEAELRQVLTAKVPDSVTIPTPVVTAPPAPPAPPVVTAPPAPPVPPVAGDVTDMAGLMANLVTPAMTTGKLQAAQFLAIIKQFGIPAIPMIKNAPHLIPEIAKTVRETIKANGHE